MRSKGNAPSATQKRWLDAVASLSPGMQIHHPVGITAKHNKVHIGHWWLVPVDEQSHRDIHAGVFGKDRKVLEKRIFEANLEALEGSPDYPPQDAIDAIRDYHR
jgi:hypothetical protein